MSATDRTLFRNRMAPANWAFMGAGFVIAIPLIVMQGTDLATAIVWALGLFLVALLVVIPIFAWLGRTQVAELTRRGETLVVEMLAPWGRGRMVEVPVAATSWRWHNPRWRVLAFSAEGRDYRLPLQGALVDAPGLGEIAPGIAGGLAGK